MSLHTSIFPSGSVLISPTATTTASGRPPEPRELAPGLTMADLDSLLREHYAKGYRDGQNKAWDAAHERIERVRLQAAREAEAALLQWMWPNVMHRVLRASEGAAEIIDGPKSTIANDRVRIGRVLETLKQSLHSFHQKKPSDV